MTAPVWKRSLLGDVIELFDHKRVPLNSRERQARKGPYPYYGAQGIIDSVDAFLFDGEFILVAEDGENLNSKKLPLALRARGKFWVNNHAHVLQGRSALVDDRFLLAAINSADIKPFVTGAAQPKLSQANLRQIELLLPPLGLQKCIAGILSAYDDLIENCERRIRVLDEMARALYREWFVDFRLGDRWSSSPAGWETKSVKDVAEVQYGMPFKSALFTDDGTLGKALVRIRDVPAGQSFTFTPEPADLRYEIHEGDVLVGMDGDFHMTVWNGGPALLNQRVARFRSQGNWSPLHLFLLLQEPIRRLNRSIVGTTVAHLGDSHIREIKVLLPPEELLRAAFHSFEPLRLLSANLARRIRNLRATRDLLLPRLLSGQLSVDDAA